MEKDAAGFGRRLTRNCHTARGPETPQEFHVRKHWHSANETHTMIIGKAKFGCEGNQVELEPGGFNYMPARMVHEAWTTPGSVVFITVDGPWDVNWAEGPPTNADFIQSQ